MARIPTGFLPIEDQGYLLVARAAARRRLARAHPARAGRGRSDSRGKVDGVAHVVTIAGISALDNNASLANAGVAYIVLKDWSDARTRLCARCSAGSPPALDARRSGARDVLPPPPIQGIGNAGGFTMQVELRDGSFDLAKLQGITNAIVANARRRARCSASRPFRSTVPQYAIDVDRVKAETLHVSVDQVFSTLAPISGRPTSTSSTSSAARSRSMCRPTRSSGCGRATSRI